jgi:enoyl-CoA hydratase
LTKKGLWSVVDAPSLHHALEMENRTQVLGTYTGCFQEAARAFAEKRPPRWQAL